MLDLDDDYADSEQVYNDDHPVSWVCIEAPNFDRLSIRSTEKRNITINNGQEFKHFVFFFSPDERIMMSSYKILAHY